MRMFYGDGQVSSSIIMDNSRPKLHRFPSKCYSSRTAMHRAANGIRGVAISARRDAHKIYRNEIAPLINS